MDPALIIAALAFLAIAGAGLAFSSGGKDGEKAKKRAREMFNRRPARRNETELATAKRKATTQEALKELSASEKQSRKRRVSVAGLIEQAGLSWSVSTFWIISAVLGAVLAGAGWLINHHPIAPAAGLVIGALGLPRWILKFLIGRRQKKFTNQLTDAIEMIVRGVKSGLPLNQCLRMIAAETPDPLRMEFKNLVDANAMGVPFEQSLQRLYERIPLPEVNFFAIVLVIQQKTGGNLSESLGNLAGVLRSRKLMRAKVAALSSEAKASAGIIGSLPFIVVTLVYMIRPDYMMMLVTEKAGNVILLVAGVMMVTGVAVMRKMINFKF